MTFDFDKAMKDAMKNWNVITDPYREENEFRLEKRKPMGRKKMSDSEEFGDVRFNVVSSGGYFVSPVEEYNYAWRKDYYGKNKRASVNLAVLRRGTYSVTDDFYGLNRF